MESDTQISVPQRFLRAAIIASSTDSTISILQAVKITHEEGNAVIYSSDSYVAVRIAWKSPFVSDLVIPAADIKRLLTTVPKRRDSDVSIEKIGENIVMSIDSMSLTTKEVEGKFPDVRAYMQKPECEAGTPTGISLKHMKRVISVFDTLNSSSNSCMKVYLDENKFKPIWIENRPESSDYLAEMVVMPVRIAGE